jgi:hypothetical protein
MVAAENGALKATKSMQVMIMVVVVMLVMIAMVEVVDESVKVGIAWVAFVVEALLTLSLWAPR